VAKELRQIPLEAAFRFWLSERLPGRAAPGGGRLSGEVVVAVMRGEEVRCEPHRLVVVPTLPIEKIPERSGDTGGALKLLEPWIGGGGGVVVLFSSPDRFFSHHQRMWNYALGWPEHVMFFTELRTYRAAQGLPDLNAGVPRTELYWNYDQRSFTDLSGQDHVVHLLTARPRGVASAPGPDELRSLRQSEDFIKKLKQVKGLGASEVVIQILDELQEYRCGMRAAVTSIRERAKEQDIDRAIINAALRECVPERFLIELRAAIEKKG
jgi:hypothetical protein